jgi:hypothetical protein
VWRVGRVRGEGGEGAWGGWGGCVGRVGTEGDEAADGDRVRAERHRLEPHFKHTSGPGT